MKLKKILCIASTVLLTLLLSGCLGMEKNQVFTPKDIEGKKVGAILNSPAYARLCTDKSLNPETVRASQTSKLAVTALKKELDCILVDSEDAEKLARSLGITMLSDSLPIKSYAFAVAKENADLVKAMNSALAVLQENGVLESIIGGYTRNTGYKYQSTLTAPTVKLTLAYAPRCAPFCYKDASGNITGIDIDVATAVCDIIGIGLELRDTGEELIEETKKGQVAIAAGMLAVEDDNSDTVSYTSPYYVSKVNILVRK